MVTLAAGAVVLVPFPFSNPAQAKPRPAVALADAGRGDWILCQVTSCLGLSIVLPSSSVKLDRSLDSLNGSRGQRTRGWPNNGTCAAYSFRSSIRTSMTIRPHPPHSSPTSKQPVRLNFIWFGSTSAHNISPIVNTRCWRQLTA